MSVLVYSKPMCPYCVKAKEFLKAKQIPFQEELYDPLEDDDYEAKRDALIARTSHKTFPQIFAGNVFIGGYTEMVMSYATKKLHNICESELGIHLQEEDDF